MRQLRAGDSEAERLHLFPPAKKSPAREFASRCRCCRGHAELATQPAPPAARDSTSRTGARSFGAAAEDYAGSTRRRADAPRYEARRMRRDSRRKAQLAGYSHGVAIRRTPRALPARSARAAPAQCCRRILDNSFPRFRRRDRSILQPPKLPNAPRGLRCRRSAKRKYPHGRFVALDAILPSIIPIPHSGTGSLFGRPRLRRSARWLEIKSDDRASDQKRSQQSIRRRLRGRREVWAKSSVSVLRLSHLFEQRKTAQLVFRWRRPHDTNSARRDRC